MVDDPKSHSFRLAFKAGQQTGRRLFPQAEVVVMPPQKKSV